MRVDEAKQLILTLALGDALVSGIPIDPQPPDRDAGKFLINWKPARVIHHYSGWNVPINLDWFEGSFAEPQIHGTPFYWYAFAIPRWSRYKQEHYFLCDYLQMREWVLDFAAPLGKDHRDHRFWRADLRLYPDPVTERRGYFRWGDEPFSMSNNPARVFELDNLGTTGEPIPLGQHVGTFGRGGESSAHKLLKLFVAEHPLDFGLSGHATAEIEYPFVTGDRVDVMFANHQPDRTVAEIEVEGATNVCVGIHQAIKYRALAAADVGYPLASDRVGSIVVAYETRYPAAIELAERYDVNLFSVDRELVLANSL